MWKSWDKLPENMKTDAVLPYYEALRRHRAGLIVKRIADILLSSVLIVVLSPVLLVIAVLIKIDSPGPVFYRQVRVTRYNKDFRIFKFRTMIVNADEKGALVTTSNDSRITRVGSKLRKYRLDEFPQFFNVLKGDMSLVGTRPPTLDEWEKYELHHRARLAIKPGITGMWQVSGRSEITDFEEVVKLDTEYIANWDVGLDFKILFKTVMSVLKKEGSM